MGRKFNVRKTSVLCTLSLHLVLSWFVLKNIFKFYGKSLGVFSGENVKLSYENFLLELAFRCSACHVTLITEHIFFMTLKMDVSFSFHSLRRVFISNFLKSIVMQII